MEYIIIQILLIHFLADFGLQTREQAQKKGEGNSFENVYLFEHVLNYSLVFFVWFWAQTERFSGALLFFFMTFFTHYLTDWITSRLSKPLFKSENYHDGFVIVGADQLIHTITLIFTYKILTL